MAFISAPLRIEELCNVSQSDFLMQHAAPGPVAVVNSQPLMTW